ncbi:hypothetical protein DFH06DRAFT_1470004, partial [Mycena polygramma]
AFPRRGSHINHHHVARQLRQPCLLQALHVLFTSLLTSQVLGVLVLVGQLAYGLSRRFKISVSGFSAIQQGRLSSN